jgi:hypothetical protein
MFHGGVLNYPTYDKDFTHNTYKEEYTKDEDFKEVFYQIHGQICVEEDDGKVDYHL